MINRKVVLNHRLFRDTLPLNVQFRSAKPLIAVIGAPVVIIRRVMFRILNAPQPINLVRKTNIFVVFKEVFTTMINSHQICSEYDTSRITEHKSVKSQRLSDLEFICDALKIKKSANHTLSPHSEKYVF